MRDDARLIAEINAGTGTALELGCGAGRARPGHVTVDLRDLPSVDLCGDVYDILARLDDNVVSGVFASHFIEHVPDLDRLLNEVVRVCRDGAIVEFTVPHFSNAFFYSDPTHHSFFGLYTFAYKARSEVRFRRTVPDYARVDGLVLEGVKLVFKSYRPFFVRHAFRKAVQFLVNLGVYMKELYEEAGTGWVSCYEIAYRLRVDKPAATD